MHCTDRILQALRFEEKTAKQLSDELFVHRSDIRRYLAQLCSSGKVHRSFWHNEVTNKPDWRYSSVAYPPKYVTMKDSSLVEMVGAWDAMDIRKVHC